MFPRLTATALALGGVAPGASPHWRWDLANCVAGPADRAFMSVDDDTRRAVAYLRGGTDVALAEAARTFLGDRHVRDRLEASVLTGRPVAAIADKLGIGPPVVESYELLFFDSRCRLDTRGWIAAHALGAGWRPGWGARDLGSLLRWVGYTRGPLLLDLLLAVHDGVARATYPANVVAAAELLLMVARLEPGRSPRSIINLYRLLSRNSRTGHRAIQHAPATAPGSDRDADLRTAAQTFGRQAGVPPALREVA